MTAPLNEASFAAGVRDLADRDQHLAGAVERWGEPPFWTHEPGFVGLVLEILSQQVSLESADAAYAKLIRHIGPVAPETILVLDDAALKAIGFSRQKAGYVRGLAQAIVDGALDLDTVGQMDDDSVRAALLPIKGIGPWTADCYLLFALRRPDAWPTGDLALVKAMQEVLELDDVPGYPEADAIAEAWRPWRAVAARILWHAYLSRRER